MVYTVTECSQLVCKAAQEYYCDKEDEQEREDLWRLPKSRNIFRSLVALSPAYGPESPLITSCDPADDKQG